MMQTAAAYKYDSKRTRSSTDIKSEVHGYDITNTKGWSKQK